MLGFMLIGSDLATPLLGVRAVLGEPNPPKSSDYYSVSAV